PRKRHWRHELNDRRDRPCVMRELTRSSDADNTDEPSAGIDHWQGTVTAPHHLFHHKILSTQVRCDDDWWGVHQVGRGHPAQALAQRLVLAGRFRGIVEEPADERRPDATDQVAAEYARDAPDDHQPTECLACV